MGRRKIRSNELSVPSCVLKAMEGDEELFFIPKTKWNSITDRLTEKKRAEAAEQRQQAYLRYMKELSTKLVTGSVTIKEDAVKRLELKQNKEKDENKMMNDYLQIKKKQKEKRDEIVDRYRRAALINRTPTLELTSALKHAQTLYERQKQVELKKEIMEKEKYWKKREMEEFQRQIEAAELIQQRKEEHVRCQVEELKRDVWKQYLNNEEEKQKEYNERITQEQIDFIAMDREWTEIKQLKKKEKDEKKKKSLDILKANAEYAKQKRNFEKQEEKEIYKVNEVIQNARIARDCRIRAQRKKEADERQNRIVAFSVKYQSQIPPIKPSEETIYQNGVRRTQEIYERQVNERKCRLKRQAEEKTQNYLEDMERQKKKEEEENELKRMEMVERFKKVEAMKYLDEMENKKQMEKKKIYGFELIRQASELKAMKEHEKKLEDNYIFTSFTQQDDQFVEYADEVMKLARKEGWPTLPIKKAILEYKKKQPIIYAERKEAPCQKSSIELHCSQKYKILSPRVEKKFLQLDQLINSFE